MADHIKGHSCVALSECFKYLGVEAKDLFIPDVVPVIRGIPNPFEFFRKFISTNNPVLIQGALDHWPALQLWTPNYFKNTIGEKKISVAVTPDGYADALVNKLFVMPEERTMAFKDFLQILEAKEKKNGVFYIQKQNSNMMTDFPDLLQDIEMDISWATEAFGHIPDALNFWMGDSRSITSLHKDNYENLYCVVSGEKHFILYPPTDLPFLYYDKFKPAVYQENDSGKFETIPIKNHHKVPWISVNPLAPDFKKFPEFAHAHPVKCVVKAGEILYIPSLWFHHVQQSHGCIAVNFWYDMNYDLKYVYFKFLEKLMDFKVPSCQD